MALTPFALENAPLMRRLQAQDFPTKTQLAADLGRDVSNLNKTLRRLQVEGLVCPVSATLTDAGANAVRDLDRLEGGGGAVAATDCAMPIGFALLHPQQLTPDPLNPRKHFDPDAIAELAESIARDDLLENLVVRPRPGVTTPLGEGWSDERQAYTIVAGERRFRAIQHLAQAGRWDADRPIPCKVIEIDDAAHRRIALVENLQRKDLRPIDEAAALKDLMEVTGQGTAEVAAEIGFTQRFVQQRLQLLSLPTSLQEKLNAGELTVERGREAAAIWPKLPPIKQIELRDGKITVEDAKAWAAGMPEPVEFEPEELLILLEVAWAIAGQSSNGYWTDTPCSHRLPTLPRAMETANWLRFSHSWQSDVMQVGLTPGAYRQVVALAGAVNRTALEQHVRKARVLALGKSPLHPEHDPQAFAKVDALFKAKRNVTEWLNGPFEADPARKAERETARQQNAARHEEWAEQARQREAAEQAQAASAQRADEGSRQLVAQMVAEEGAWSSEAVATVCVDAGHPLPWSVREENDDDEDWQEFGIVDANGEDIDLYDRALNRLFVAFMNNAGSKA